MKMLGNNQDFVAGPPWPPDSLSGAPTSAPEGWTANVAEGRATTRTNNTRSSLFMDASLYAVANRTDTRFPTTASQWHKRLIEAAQRFGRGAIGRAVDRRRPFV